MSGLMVPMPAVALSAGVVDVWFLPLDVPDEERRELTRVLDAAERARWARTRVHGDRWAVARALRRHVLGAYLGEAPASLEFAHGPFGKPWLAASGAPRFSASARGGLALLAVASGIELGADLEREDTAADPGQVAREFLKPIEQAVIAAAAPAARRRAFAQAWARHEALRKLHGTGLGEPLPARYGSAPVVVRGVHAPAGHAAAVAAGDAGWRVRVRAQGAVHAAL